MDLEVYMRESSLREHPQPDEDDHRGLERLTGDGKSYPAIRERDSHSHENPTREHFRRDTQSFGEGWGNI